LIYYILRGGIIYKILFLNQLIKAAAEKPDPMLAGSSLVRPNSQFWKIEQQARGRGR
jgi:hypothetical protein